MKPLRFAGIAASVLFFVVALIAALYNPWFSFLDHAFSHLGKESANFPWIYNVGMMVLGGLIFLYAITFIHDAANKLETVGGTLLIVSGLLLAMVGVYYDGRGPHAFVSTWFFLVAEMGMFAAGVGLLSEDFAVGLTILAAGAIGIITEIVASFPSIAFLEFFAIMFLALRVILLTKVQLERVKTKNLPSP